jgi:hypothetical protein
MEGTKITVEPIAEIAYDGAALGIRLQFKITYFGDEATINGLNQIFKIIITPHTTLSFSDPIQAIVPNGTYPLSPDPYYSWGPISIPVPFTCNDITTLVSNYNTTTTLKDVDVIKGRSAYALGTETTTTFNGFWITEENDGTIGLYDVDYSAGTPHNYLNVSSQVGLDCCKVIDDAFTAYTETFKQGVDTYPSISWDNNKNKCVYRKCGDSGCIDLDEVLTTELSAIDTVKEFASTLSSELIDVKNRKTLSGYPTLKMLYDRYNTRSEEFGGIASSKYDYFDMDKFGHTVGDYWIDLIEQVIPATTIWGSTYTYKNTVFDQQKFNYRNSNIYFCEDPIGQSIRTTNTTVPFIPANSSPQVGYQRDRYLDASPDLSTMFYYMGPVTFNQPGGYLNNVDVLISNDDLYFSDSTLTGNGTGKRAFQYNNGIISQFGIEVIASQSPNYNLTQFAKDIEDDFASRNNGFQITVNPIAKIFNSVSGVGLKLQFEIIYLGDEVTVNGLDTISLINIIPDTKLAGLGFKTYKSYFRTSPLKPVNFAAIPCCGPDDMVWQIISNKSPFTLLASNSNTSVIIKEIPKPIAPNPDGTVNLSTIQPSVKKCNGVYLLDRNCDSQFLGTVKQMDNLGNITLI